jgi:hypothetical protein
MPSKRGRVVSALVVGLSVTGFAAAGVAQTTDLLPPNAKPGECYARVFIPPNFKTTTETIVKREASEKIEVIPAEYEWVQEKIVVKEASEKLEVVPATYEWKEEKVLVKPAATKIEEVPAVYEWVEEKVLDKPAHTVWKKGTGPIQRIDHGTGEIMCLVEVPATYKTIRKRALKQAATTKKVEIPPEYKTIKKQVMTTPPTTRKVEIPAEYKTIKVLKLVSAAKEQRIAIPEQRQEVTKTEKVSEGRVEWQPILCQTNLTRELGDDIQTALLHAGHDPGPIDGVIGAQTMAALRSFQQKKGLATGGLTVETLKELGVSLARATTGPALQ